ncbi:hypothetical protein [Aliarcobacter butzleri]|nr:hypothetical protein [Aliarcobacter butzleri]MCT7577658.1 hypothetical protein [Aliarcobacter butzleri]
MILKILQNKIFTSFVKYFIMFMLGFLTATILLGLRFIDNL